MATVTVMQGHDDSDNMAKAIDDKVRMRVTKQPSDSDDKVMMIVKKIAILIVMTRS